MTTIAYKTIQDFPDYLINSAGDVLRRTQSGNLRTIKPWLNRTHYAVTLTNQDCKKVFYLHRLVLIAFGPKQPKHLPLALHKDDDTSNNDLSNLIWGDKRMNAQMAVSNGRLCAAELRVYLTKDEAEQVRQAHDSGLSMSRIAKQFGCSRWTISNIVNGRVAKFL